MKQCALAPEPPKDDSEELKDFGHLPSDFLPPPKEPVKGIDDLDTMVRDFTKVGSRPKSEVRRRIMEFAAAEYNRGLGDRDEAIEEGMALGIERGKKEGSKKWAQEYLDAQKAFDEMKPILITQAVEEFRARAIREIEGMRTIARFKIINIIKAINLPPLK
jgi:flagellar biosynthesis/type III secretory pathway protein FliH